MKKKVLALFMVISIVFSVTGCKINSSERLKRNDFYEYINQELLSEIELTAKDAYWDWFGELNAIILHDMRDIITELSEDGIDYERGSSEQKIKDLYECVSDMDNRNQTGLGPLQPHLDSIRNAASIAEYADALAKLSDEFGFSSIVGGYTIMQDKTDSSEYAVYLMYADTLIGKEYIEGENTQEYVKMYLDYIKNMLMEFGMSEDEAVQSTDSIEKLLRDICASSLTTEQRYDPSLTYNVYTEQELQALYTNIDVPKMLKTLQVDGQDKYIVTDVKQAEKINSLLVEENLQALKDYSTFVMLNDTAEYAGEAYVRLNRDMQNALYGITENRDDKDIWMNLTQELLPWDFGMIYVEDHFSAEDKKAVEDMIEIILEEYEEILNRQEWMSDATKQKAIRKLETMTVKIGYPDQWPAARDMMQITPISEGGSLLSNLLISMQVAIEDTRNKLGTKVDRSEWDVAPQTINAMYDPLNNEIIFPAGILQAPFYDSEYSYGANWGGIGFIIAHEVSHAFDSSGALYDEYGNYNQWWSDEEFNQYVELSEAIVDYYNQYEISGTHVNGDLTLMENIADLGAITCVASALEGNSQALDDAFRQLAFNWASKSTETFMVYLLNTDTHSPNKVRVNAVLSSCDAFYEIYQIKKSDGMYVAPDSRVGIWK
jgi:putative endopeptidase